MADGDDNQLLTPGSALVQSQGAPIASSVEGSLVFRNDIVSLVEPAKKSSAGLAQGCATLTMHSPS